MIVTRALFEPDIFSLSTEDEISGPVNISEETRAAYRRDR